MAACSRITRDARTPRPLLALVLLAVLVPTTGLALTWQPAHYRCPRTDQPPRIDGQLDDPAWRRAPWTDDFVDIEGARRPLTPRFRTRAKLLWDEHALYVAAALEEPHVWGTLTGRDAVIYADNDFEVFLDPDGDHHLYGELEINARGTEWDLLLVRPYRDGGPAVNGWTMVGLETAVHVDGTLNVPSDTDRGWSVEMAIPWDALRDLARDRACPPEPGDWWRLNFSRVQWEHRVEDGQYVKTPVPGRGWKGEDNWVWTPQGAVAMHQPETWGFVSFVADTADVVADPRESLRPVYELLWPVYAAQRLHLEAHGEPARRLADLAALPAAVRGELTSRGARLAASSRTWSATLMVAGRRWLVDHEGRLTTQAVP